MNQDKPSVELKPKHSEDCTFYSSLVNGRPEDGICTCGYGLEQVRKGNYDELVSEERENTRPREASLLECLRMAREALEANMYHYKGCRLTGKEALSRIAEVMK